MAASKEGKCRDLPKTKITGGDVRRSKVRMAKTKALKAEVSLEESVRTIFPHLNSKGC